MNYYRDHRKMKILACSEGVAEVVERFESVESEAVELAEYCSFLCREGEPGEQAGLHQTDKETITVSTGEAAAPEVPKKCDDVPENPGNQRTRSGSRLQQKKN